MSDMPLSRQKRTRQLDGLGRGEGRVMRQHRDVNGGYISETADARRAEVYRTDVEFAKHMPEQLPPVNTSERRVLAKRVAELREAGWSYQKIADELNLSNGSAVGYLLREVRKP